MATKRTSLSAVDLTEQPRRRPGRPRKEATEDRGEAGTLRLPEEFWYRLRVAAAIRRTTMAAIVQEALQRWFEANPLPPGIEG